MKKIVGGIIGIFLFIFPTISYADGVIIPFSFNVGKFKKEMKDIGYDLYGKEDSFGEVNGNKVITYKSVTPEQMDIMKEVAFKTMNRGK